MKVQTGVFSPWKDGQTDTDCSWCCKERRMKFHWTKFVYNDSDTDWTDSTQYTPKQTNLRHDAYHKLLGEFKQIRAGAIAWVYIWCNDPISAGIGSSSLESEQMYQHWSICNGYLWFKKSRFSDLQHLDNLSVIDTIREKMDLRSLQRSSRSDLPGRISSLVWNSFLAAAWNSNVALFWAHFQTHNSEVQQHHPECHFPSQLSVVWPEQLGKKASGLGPPKRNDGLPHLIMNHGWRLFEHLI